MKKNKLLLAGLLLAGALTISACNMLPTAHRRSSKEESSEISEVQMPEAYKIYQLYVAQGGTQTYEEWLESVRGEKGDPGHSPTVTIGNNGNWYIDGRDTGIHAQGAQGNQGEKGDQGEQGEQGEKGDQGVQGEQGDKGDDGKSAYEQYLETHPDYNKSEEEWLDDLINGRLASLVSHTVSFNSNGGSAVESQQIYHGEKVNSPDEPTKPGYTFKGWTYQGEPWSFFGHVVTEDMVLEAVWEAIDYTVTFVNEDGTVLETQENLHYGDHVSYNGLTPTKVNPQDHCVYTFTGWDKELVVDGNLVLTAQFEEEFVPFEERYLDANDNIVYRHYVRQLENNAAIFNYQGIEHYDGKLRLEAEDADVIAGSVGLEEHDDVSGGKNIGSFYNGSEMQFTFNCSSQSQVTMRINFAVDGGRGHKIKDRLMILINGVELEISDDVIWQTTNGWVEWEVVEIGSANLKYGENKIVLHSIECTNIDYVDIDGVAAFNPIDAGVEEPTKPTENGIMYKFRNWVEDNRTSDTVIYKPLFDACTVGLSFENGQVYYYEGTEKEVHVPSFWDGRLIKSVSRRAFEGTEVEKVYLAEGITTIDEYAFRNCPKLEEVELPSTLTLIKEYAFEYCSSLKGIDIPNGVTDIRYRAFAECTSLETLSLPNTITYIRNDSFWNCCSLKSLVIPESVTYLESGCFLGCRLLESVTFPEGLTRLCNGCFADCKSLTSIVLSSTVERIDDGAFRNCDRLSSIFIPASVEVMEDNVFRDDNYLTIYVEATSKPKDWSSFWSCDRPVVWAYEQQVTENGYTYALYENNGEKFANVIDFDKSITEFMPPQAINGYQVVSMSIGIFKGHANLTSAVIPEGIDIIPTDMFEDCPLLTFNEYGNGLYIGSPNNPYFALIKGANKEITSLTTHQDCKLMANEAFSGYQSLSSVTLNEGLKIIPQSAFLWVEQLHEITIPSTVKRIERDAFHGCCGMSTVTVSEGLEYIGGSAFEYCTSLQSFTVPSTVTYIGGAAFLQGYALRTITFLSPVPPVVPGDLVRHAWENNDNLKIIVPKGSLEAYAAINDELWQENAVCKLVEADE